MNDYSYLRNEVSGDPAELEEFLADPYLVFSPVGFFRVLPLYRQSIGSCNEGFSAHGRSGFR